MNSEATHHPIYSTQRCCNLQIALQEEVKNSCLLNTKLQKEKKNQIFIPPLIQSSPPPS
jgi:hypothetical protein